MPQLRPRRPRDDSLLCALRPGTPDRDRLHRSAVAAAAVRAAHGSARELDADRSESLRGIASSATAAGGAPGVGHAPAASGECTCDPAVLITDRAPDRAAQHRADHPESLRGTAGAAVRPAAPAVRATWLRLRHPRLCPVGHQWPRRRVVDSRDRRLDVLRGRIDPRDRPRGHRSQPDQEQRRDPERRRHGQGRDHPRLHRHRAGCCLFRAVAAFAGSSST